MGSKVLFINTGGTLSSVARQHGLTLGLTTDSMLKEPLLPGGGRPEAVPGHAPGGSENVCRQRL